MKKIITLVICLLGVTFLKAQGRIGINTNSPAAMLHVQDSNVLFTASTLAGYGSVPVSGSGRRFMWVAGRGAIRSGEVTGTHWNQDSIGYNSAAFGINATAIGTSSIAGGQTTRAAGTGSVALGGNTSANGSFSFAHGASSNAIGNFSVAMGQSSDAFGDHSVSMGLNCQAFGNRSFAMGISSNSYGANSFTMGDFANGFGDNSFAFGFSSSTYAAGAVAMGYGARASGIGAAAFNIQSAATGYGATALGYATTARPYASLAIGYNNDSIITSSPNTWVDTDPIFMIGNGSSIFSPSNALTVLKNARMGINTTSPQAMLHLVKGAPTGGTFHNSSSMIIEGNSNSYLSFSTPTANEAGIIAASNITSLKSGIFFRPDSAIHFRTGGNNTRISIRTDGNVGIRTTDPQAALDIKGVGSNDNRHIRLESTGSTSAANIFYSGDLFFKNNLLDGDFYFQNSTGTNALSIFSSGNLSTPGGLTLTGELNRTSTGASNMVPICYGSISSSAVINSGTGNFSVSNSSAGTYLVSISSESYTNGYITSVSPVSGASARVVTTGTSGTDLIIRIFDLTGTLVNTAFHFVIYKN